jgi:hypothetical protein
LLIAIRSSTVLLVQLRAPRLPQRELGPLRRP